MRIELYTAEYHDRLVTIWERSVRATHDFLTESDIVFFKEIVQTAALQNSEIYIAIKNEYPVGFIGLENTHIDMLFLDPDYFQQGIGKALLLAAQRLKGDELSVDVNEDNHSAILFYQRSGFVQTGRSEVDGFRRSFPLLHLTYKNCG